MGGSDPDVGADGVCPLREPGRRDAAGHGAGDPDRDAELARDGDGLDPRHFRHRGVRRTAVHQPARRVRCGRPVHGLHPRLQTRSQV